MATEKTEAFYSTNPPPWQDQLQQVVLDKGRRDQQIQAVEYTDKAPIYADNSSTIQPPRLDQRIAHAVQKCVVELMPIIIQQVTHDIVSEDSLRAAYRSTPPDPPPSPLTPPDSPLSREEAGWLQPDPPPTPRRAVLQDAKTPRDANARRAARSKREAATLVEAQRHSESQRYFESLTSRVLATTRRTKE